jgi:hypothetical protein
MNHKRQFVIAYIHGTTLFAGCKSLSRVNAPSACKYMHFFGFYNDNQILFSAINELAVVTRP